MSRGEEGEARRLVMVLAYEGTSYRGSQVQPGQPTIHGELARALYQLTGEEPRLAFASRTDAGAHAEGQVASALLSSRLSEGRLVAGLNYYLPESIAVQEAWWASSDFDVRRAPTRRRYRYIIVNTPQRSPLWWRRAYHVPEPLDAGLMDDALQCQVGRRDVGPFVSASATRGRSTLRTIYRAGAWREGELVLVELEGDAFLAQQVRRTVGTLVQVGRGQMTVREFGSLCRGEGVGQAGPAAPAYGLYLMQVTYRLAPPSGCGSESGVQREKLAVAAGVMQ